MGLSSSLFGAIFALLVNTSASNVFPRQTSLSNSSSVTNPPTPITTTSITTSSTSISTLSCVSGVCLLGCQLSCVIVTIGTWWSDAYTVTAATEYQTWGTKDGQVVLFNSSISPNLTGSAFLRTMSASYTLYLPGVPTDLIATGPQGPYDPWTIPVLGTETNVPMYAVSGTSIVSNLTIASPTMWTSQCGGMTIGVTLASGTTTATGSNINFEFALPYLDPVAVQDASTTDLSGAGELFVPMGTGYISQIALAAPTIPLTNSEIEWDSDYPFSFAPEFPFSLCTGTIDGIPGVHIPVSALTVTSATTLAAKPPSIPAGPVTTTTANPGSSGTTGGATMSTSQTSAATSTLESSSSTGVVPSSGVVASGTAGGSASAVTTNGQGGGTSASPQNAGSVFSSLLNTDGGQGGSNSPSLVSAQTVLPSPSAAATGRQGGGTHSTPLNAGNVFSSLLNTNNGPGDSNGQSSMPSRPVVSSASAATIGGQTLSAGGTPAVIEGVTYSLATSGSALVINGATTPLASATQVSQISSAPVLMGTPITVAGTTGAVVFGSITLLPGSQVTAGQGTILSLPSSGSGIVVVNGATVPLGSAVTTNGATGLVVGSQTLFPSSVITMSGTILSLDSSGSVVAVQTLASSSGLGGAIMSGIGYTSTASSTGVLQTGASASSSNNAQGPASTGGATVNCGVLGYSLMCAFIVMIVSL